MVTVIKHLGTTRHYLFRPTVARKAIYLVTLIVTLGGGNLLWTSHAISSSTTGEHQATQKAIQAAIDINNRSWCDSLTLITSGPAPTAKQPGLVKLYDDFHRLERKFGCDK